MSLISFKDYLKNTTTSQQTINARLYDVASFEKSHKKVNSDTVQKFVGEMIDKGMDPKTVARRVGSLRVYAQYKGINLGDVNVPKQRRKIPRIMSNDELNKLFDEVVKISVDDGFDAMTLKTLFILLNLTPRKSEVLNIRIRDIDLAGKKIKIHGKRDKEMFKPITVGENIIREYIDLRDELGITCEYLLVRKYSGEWKQLRDREMYHMLEDFTEQVIGWRVNPHSFRHTIATAWLNAGMDLRYVQELLGHESIATTQFYTHLAIDNLSDKAKSFHPLNQK